MFVIELFIMVFQTVVSWTLHSIVTLSAFQNIVFVIYINMLIRQKIPIDFGTLGDFCMSSTHVFFRKFKDLVLVATQLSNLLNEGGWFDNHIV